MTQKKERGGEDERREEGRGGVEIKGKERKKDRIMAGSEKR